MIKKIHIEAGHNDNDPGASAHGYIEAEELHDKIDGKEMNFEERDLLETLLVKRDENE